MPEKEADSGEFRTLQKMSQRVQLLVWLGSLIVACVGGALYVSARPTRSEVVAMISERAPSRIRLVELKGEIKTANLRYAGIEQRIERMRRDVSERLKAIEELVRDLYRSSASPDPPKKKRRR